MLDFAKVQMNQAIDVLKAAGEATRLRLLVLLAQGDLTVTELTETERADLVDILAFHFTEAWGAPNIDAARPVAEGEIAQMCEMCGISL